VCASLLERNQRMIDWLLALFANAAQNSGVGRGEMVFFVVGVVITILCLIVFFFLIRLANEDEKRGHDGGGG